MATRYSTGPAALAKELRGWYVEAVLEDMAMGMATKETLADMIDQRRLVQVPSGLMSKVCALPFCAAPSHFPCLIAVSRIPP